MSHINSVRVLRKYQQQFSTREFKARGAALKRCPECMLAESQCVCGQVSPVDTELGVCMLMYHAEYFKPSNTGQLITELVPKNFAFRWERTTVEDELLALINDPTWFPIIIFPHDNVVPERQIHQVPKFELKKLGKQPLFIFIDATWRQAKKIMVKSPYLANLPVLQVSDVSKGEYQLREAFHEHHLSTVEVAIKIFEEMGEQLLAERLNTLFTLFRTGYKEFKR